MRNIPIRDTKVCVMWNKVKKSRQEFNVENRNKKIYVPTEKQS